MKSDTFIMVEGTAALIEKLGIIEAERYISNLRNTEPRPFGSGQERYFFDRIYKINKRVTK
jgi:hypothetical protein